MVKLYRIVLKEELAPLVLDVEEEAKDEEEVAEGDEDDHHEAAVHGHPPHPLFNRPKVLRGDKNFTISFASINQLSEANTGLQGALA